jgi:ComF family protein
MQFLTFAQKCGFFAGPPRLGQPCCLLCDEAGEAPGLCETCCALVGPSTSGLRSAHGTPVVAAFAYRFPLDHLVHRFKFSADFATGVWLADALSRVARLCPAPEVLVPAPSSARRLRERGFDPALLLARQVSRRVGVPVDARSLRKVRHTPPQTSLSRAERSRNLAGAFACGPSLRGRSVAVIDDVLTTGATQRAIAASLLDAGVREVAAWVVAATPPPV